MAGGKVDEQAGRRRDACVESGQCARLRIEQEGDELDVAASESVVEWRAPAAVLAVVRGRTALKQSLCNLQPCLFVARRRARESA